MTPSNITIGEMFLILLCTILKEPVDVAHFKAYFASLGEERHYFTDSMLTKLVAEVNRHFDRVRLSKKSFIDTRETKIYLRCPYNAFHSAYAGYVTFTKVGTDSNAELTFATEDSAGNVKISVMMVDGKPAFTVEHRCPAGTQGLIARHLLASCLTRLGAIKIGVGPLVKYQPWKPKTQLRLAKTAAYVNPHGHA